MNISNILRYTFFFYFLTSLFYNILLKNTSFFFNIAEYKKKITIHKNHCNNTDTVQLFLLHQTQKSSTNKKKNKLNLKKKYILN